jgi:acetoin utilization deacetylase AcuC-like enzyme
MRVDSLDNVNHTSEPSTEVRAFYCDHFVLPLPEGHRFPMAKYARLRERIVAEGLVNADDLREPIPASWADLGLVHTDEYLRDVECGTLSRDTQRRIGFPWSLEMVERARRSVGATIQAARAALEDGAAANLAGGTHHAFADRGEGFCVFNDVAVASRVLIRDGAVQRVIVIDCDVHQGNGTARIFANEPAVFTLSMHGRHNFPFRKETSDLDVVLEDGTGDEDYLACLARHVPYVLDSHRPDIAFYVSGADPYEGDRFGRLKLTIHGLRQRDRFVFAECRSRGIPVVVTMAGGYANDIDAIVTIHANTIREAVLGRLKPAPTRDELKPAPTRDDLTPGPTRDDLEPGPTSEELKPRRTSDELKPGPTGDEFHAL